MARVRGYLSSLASMAADYVQKAGDTMTGALVAPSVTGTSFLASGTLPATSGALRLPNGTSGDIVWRNSTNTADSGFIRYGGSNTFEMWSEGVQAFVVNSATRFRITATGVFMPNAATVRFRNADNTADITTLTVDSSDQTTLSGAVSNSTVVLGATDSIFGAPTNVRLQTGGTTRATITATGAFFGGIVAIGTNPAAAGTLRLPNAGTIQFRNAANNANVEALTVDSSDQTELKGGSQSYVRLGASEAWFNAQSGVAIRTGGATRVSFAANLVNIPGTELRLSHTTNPEINFSALGPKIIPGTNTPEGAVTAPVGSLFLRADGGAGSTLYVKESGTGNTGWVAK
jgi:hypothetical protein